MGRRLRPLLLLSGGAFSGSDGSARPLAKAFERLEELGRGGVVLHHEILIREGAERRQAPGFEIGAIEEVGFEVEFVPGHEGESDAVRVETMTAKHGAGVDDTEGRELLKEVIEIGVGFHRHADGLSNTEAGADAGGHLGGMEDAQDFEAGGESGLASGLGILNDEGTGDLEAFGGKAIGSGVGLELRGFTAANQRGETVPDAGANQWWFDLGAVTGGDDGEWQSRKRSHQIQGFGQEDRPRRHQGIEVIALVGIGGPESIGVEAARGSQGRDHRPVGDADAGAEVGVPIEVDVEGAERLHPSGVVEGFGVDEHTVKVEENGVKRGQLASVAWKDSCRKPGYR